LTQPVKRPLSGKLLLVFSVLLGALVVVGFYPDLFERWILDPPLFAIRSFLSGMTGVSRDTSGFFTHYVDLLGVQQENLRLKTQVAKLNRELAHEKILNLRTRDLESLLALKARISQKAIACHVMAANSTDSPRTLLLDCGKDRGVAVRDGVIGSRGVVGYVIRVFDVFSQVIWVEDPLFALEGRLTDSGQRGLVRGRGGERPLSLRYIPSLTHVDKGSEVVTTGEDGYFPPEEPIGTVVSLGNSGHRIFQTIHLSPEERLGDLWAVFVLVPPLSWTASPLLGKESR
jgi:rod shape-determining protein MreC